MYKHVITGIVIILYCLTFCAAQDKEVGDQCTTKEGASGKCIDVKNCKSALDKIKKGQSPQICRFNRRDPIVCCPSSELNSNKPVNRKPGVISKRKCDEYLKKKGSDENSFFIAAVNGIRALPKEFLHMAAIGFGEKGNIQWLCGGSLISDKYILTAAHCLSSASQGKAKWVRLGDLDLESNKDDAKPQDFEIKRSIKHPQYSSKTKQNDIALLELNRRVTMTEYVKPACLDTQKRRLNEQAMTATGWGLTDFAGVPSAHLIKVYLDEFKYDRCYQLFGRDKINSETQLCIGSNAEKPMDTCKGDSGGPLQISHPVYQKSHILVGVTSYGKACGLQNVPGVYTKVLPFVPWIENIVWP